MKRYLMLLFLWILILCSLTSCRLSLRSKLSQDDVIMIDKNEERTHYTVRENSEKSIIVNTLIDAKKASSKQLKDLDRKDPMFLITADYEIYIDNQDGKHIYHIWLNKKHPIIYGDYIGYRIINEEDLPRLKKLLEKATVHGFINDNSSSEKPSILALSETSP